jgi:hypothetical protein
VIEVRPMRVMSVWMLSVSPIFTGCWKAISLTAAVTTRVRARSPARMPAARSICAITHPPKISPAGLASAGIARVRSVSSPSGSG